MGKGKPAVLCGLVAVALVASTGCVTKKLFRRNVEETNSRIASAESGIESNERRIGDLKTETDSRITAVQGQAQKAMEVGSSAMSRAEQAAELADKAAKGRLIWEVTLSDDRVKFGFGKAAIPQETAAVLDDLAQNVKSYGKAVYLEIEGHTDNAGSDQYNYQLGEERALAVRNYLAMKGGIPLHAMNVISYGETEPVAENSTSNGRAQNRRVVVKVLE